MKFTLSWLKEYLDTDASLEEICTKLTDIGLEVESVENKSKTLEAFSVAKIIDLKQAENSTKLKICQVETKDSQTPLQIVCGAQNARSGIKVAYAPIGSVIPANQMVIKKAKIAGIESNGMLCSARELMIGNEDSGIIEIDDKWQIGSKITDVFALNDAVVEINVTPNRGDCLGIFGIARDLAASGIGNLKKPTIKNHPSHFPFPIECQINSSSCALAAFRYLKNVKNCDSPKWLKEKLAAVGINSISAVVDITNYVMLTLNRPMHAYDAKKIDGKIDIRFARNNEEIVSLKGDKFTTDEKVLVISDDKKIVGIAGVIGSLESSCEIITSDILLESAFFTPSAVSYSGRKLNILSDARFRFERGIDELSCEDGINLATQLILEICGGEASEIKVVGNSSERKTIEFDTTKIKKLTGLEIPTKTTEEILLKLGFIIKNSDDKFFVEIPSHRHDISQSEDLVEEVIRIFGYNKIPSIATPNNDDWTNKSYSPLNKVRSKLCLSGMTEIISWSFVDENLVECFSEKNSKLILKNPISIEMNHMRPNLMIGLLESCHKNSLRNFDNLSLFEIGNSFSSDEKQQLMISGIRTGKNKEQNHYHDERDFDVFDVKKDFFDTIEALGIRSDSVQINNDSPLKYYHPHRFASVKLGKNIIGYFGEINPKISEKFALKNRVNAFEIFIDSIPEQQNKPSSRKAFIANDLPAVERDFAFLVKKSQPVGDLVKTIINCDKHLITNVSIFDVFSGKNVGEDKKSVAIRIKIQPSEKTLTSEEINAISEKVVKTIEKYYDATLRS